jgi:hypothetical protein
VPTVCDGSPFLEDISSSLQGIGCVIGSFATGKLVDFDYKRTKRQHDERVKNSSKLDFNDSSDNFPIEQARLRSAWIMIMAFGFSTLGYGWSLEKRTHLAVPLVFQFFGTSPHGSDFVGGGN